MEKENGINPRLDVSGAELAVGDKVATFYQQLFRIGVVTGFTKSRVKVSFKYMTTMDYNTGETFRESVNLVSANVAKVANQGCDEECYFGNRPGWPGLRFNPDQA